MKCALVIGNTGQDGKILSAQLSQKNYKVWGLNSKGATGPGITPVLHAVSLFSADDMCNLLEEIIPDEIYFLAAFHHSSTEHIYSNSDIITPTFNTHVSGLVNVLDACLKTGIKPPLFYASSSHIYAGSKTNFQNENTTFSPTNLYGVSKIAGMQICQLYHNMYDWPICSGILYNHESAYRESRFVSRMIMDTAFAIYTGKEDKLRIRNPEARADWGYAPDYTHAMHLLTSNHFSGNYIISTGQTHSVRELTKIVFSLLQLDPNKYLEISKEIPPTSSTILCGDNTHLIMDTGWSPSVSFQEMIRVIMHDLKYI